MPEPDPLELESPETKAGEEPGDWPMSAEGATVSASQRKSAVRFMKEYLQPNRLFFCTC